MKEKGFTLVELLGIIIIIAIIALIGVPSVVEIINSAKEGTMKQSVRNIIHTAETLYKEEMLENGGKTPSISFEDLTYKGEQYEHGSLSFNKDQTANVAVWKNGTCAYKTSSDKDVVLDKKLSATDCLGKVGITPTGAESLINKANDESITTYSKGKTTEMYTFTQAKKEQTSSTTGSIINSVGEKIIDTIYYRTELRF